MNIFTRLALRFACFKRNLVLNEIGRVNVELEEAIFDKDPDLQKALSVYLGDLLVEQNILLAKIRKLEARIR